jgi:membrane-associated protease RseP (regulator of RpoE activity)
MKLAVILVPAFAMGAAAQALLPPTVPLPEGPVTLSANAVFKGGLMGAVMGPTVKGAPYSATETVENTQTLSDGTHINQTAQTMVYRDSQGRMRRETPDSITIWDPVANTSYVLDPKTQTAHQMRLGLAVAGSIVTAQSGVAGQVTRFVYRGADPPPLPLAGNGSIGVQFMPSDTERARAMLKANGVTEGVYVGETTPGSPAAKAGIQTGDIITAVNGKTVRDGNEFTTAVSGASVGSAMTVNVLRDGKAQTFQMVVADRARIYPDAVQPPSFPLPELMNLKQVKLNDQTESLGHQTMEGLDTQGMRITATIDTGVIGNDRPIQIVTERWYSSDLQTNVKMTHSDPRNGQETLQLTGISRAEPAPDLFQVPAGYQLVNGK